MRTKVLFVCVGNSIRSQMAEAFARHLAPDLIEPLSAGLTPCSIIQPETFRALEEISVPLPPSKPKSLWDIDLRGVHRVVNLSGWPLPGPLKRLSVDWPVADPMGQRLPAYRAARDEIRTRVEALVAELRMQSVPQS